MLTVPCLARLLLLSSDADTDILADYVLALLNADAPEAELEKVRPLSYCLCGELRLKADLALPSSRSPSSSLQELHEQLTDFLEDSQYSILLRL